MKLERVNERLPPGLGNDAVIVAASFESRSIRAMSLAADNTFVCALVLKYDDVVESAEGLFNLRDLTRTVERIAAKRVTTEACSFHDGYSAIRVVEAWLRPRAETLSGLSIDISCFTKLHLLLLLDHLYRNYQALPIRLLYTEALAYAADFGRAMTRGVRDTVYVPMAYGEAVGGRSALLMFLGHEEARAARIVEELEPDETVFLLGRPGFTPQMARMSERRNKYLLNRAAYDSQFRIALCDTSDIEACFWLLSGLIDRLANDSFTRFFIAPLGTKLQALAVHLVTRAEQRRAISVAYAIPEVYLKQVYSQGAGATYIIALTREQPINPRPLVEEDGRLVLAPA